VNVVALDLLDFLRAGDRTGAEFDATLSKQILHVTSV